jgi:hypothetical protein
MLRITEERQAAVVASTRDNAGRRRVEDTPPFAIGEKSEDTVVMMARVEA